MLKKYSDTTSGKPINPPAQTEMQYNAPKVLLFLEQLLAALLWSASISAGRKQTTQENPRVSFSCFPLFFPYCLGRQYCLGMKQCFAYCSGKWSSRYRSARLSHSWYISITSLIFPSFWVSPKTVHILGSTARALCGTYHLHYVNPLINDWHTLSCQLQKPSAHPWPAQQTVSLFPLSF